MSRKLLVCALVPVLALVLVGCPKKKPAPVKQEMAVQTREVPPPPQEVTKPPAPAPKDMVEQNPLESSDLQIVNQEAKKMGFASDIYFDFDKSDLRADARDALAGNATFLKAHPEFLLTIEGHCDERGTNEYNLALGERRANAAKDYLVSLGVDGTLLRTISYGEERPVCPESEESCWSRNRHDRMVITGRR